MPSFFNSCAALQSTTSQNRQSCCVETLLEAEALSGIKSNSRAKMKHTSRFRLVMRSLKCFSSKTSVHGFNRLSNSTSFGKKFFWSALTITGFACAFIHAWHLVQMFRSNPVNTIFKSESVDFMFPDVTICSLSPTSQERLQSTLNVSQAQDFRNLLVDTFHFVNTVLNFGTIFHGNQFINQLQRLSHRYSNISSEINRTAVNWTFTVNQWSKKWTELRKKFEKTVTDDKLLRLKEKVKEYLTILKSSFALYNISFSLDDLVLNCSYKGSLCNLTQFHLVEDNHYWNCYTFRPTDRTIVSSDLNDGLDMVLLSWSTNQFDTTQEINSNSWKDYDTWLRRNFNHLMAISLVKDLEPSGIKVIVHSPNTYPFASRRGFTISNGQMATISIKMARTHRLSRADYTCDNHLLKDDLSSKLRRTVHYQRSSAQIADTYEWPTYTATSSDENVHLVQREMHRLCGCYTHNLPYNTANGTNLCYNVTDVLMEVGHHMKLNFTSQDHIAFQDSFISANYPTELAQVRYKTTVMQSVLAHFDAVHAFYKRKHCHDTQLQHAQVLARGVNSFVAPCTNDVYEPTFSTVFWPRDPDLTLLMSQMVIPMLNKTGQFSPLANKLLLNYSDNWWSTNGKLLRQNLVRIVIHPSRTHSDEYLEEEAYTLFEALGEFGGICGLWCGLSFLTMFELMELLFDILFNILHSCDKTHSNTAAAADDDVAAVKQNLLLTSDLKMSDLDVGVNGVCEKCL